MMLVKPLAGAVALLTPPETDVATTLVATLQTTVLTVKFCVAVVTEHEDLCNAWLEFNGPRGRCVANITASRLALKTERVTRITGENAYIKIDYASKNGTMIRRIANEESVSKLFD